MITPWPMKKPDNDIDSILSYSSDSEEYAELCDALEEIKSQTVDLPLIVDGKKIWTDDITELRAPHDHATVLAKGCIAGEEEVGAAIEAALAAQYTWAEMDGYHRAAIFRHAADTLAGDARIRTLAAIMVNLSKTPQEAEIDLAELVDLWRFNAYYLEQLSERQPEQAPGEMNRMDWRPLEGFVTAITPFNFFAIAGNLPSAPALAGNVVIWKPSRSVLLANFEIMSLLLEAGLPNGVINFVPFSHDCTDDILTHPSFAGLHFTGSYSTLIHFWKTIHSNIDGYRNFPRIVGEGGGKDFIFIHRSADIHAVADNIIRGAFEYQGQKCSAVSRVYVPESVWPLLRNILTDELPRVRYGVVEEFSNFMGALIDERAYNRVCEYLEFVRAHPDEYEIVYGGAADAEEGWFVEPTLIATNNPRGKLMREEIFGPLVTVSIYPDTAFLETLELCDATSPYALTGAIFAKDRTAITLAEQLLRYSAGNFYINDKPTGAVVARQPFGGARHSGTNDKAGSWLNLLRWVNPRVIKESTIAPSDWRRPYMF